MKLIATLLLTAHQCAALSLSRSRRQFLGSAGIGAGAALSLPLQSLAAGRPKVVVVGGAGFVGSNVAQLLVREGADVVSVSRRSVEAQQAAIQYASYPRRRDLDARRPETSKIAGRTAEIQHFPRQATTASPRWSASRRAASRSRRSPRL